LGSRLKLQGTFPEHVSPAVAHSASPGSFDAHCAAVTTESPPPAPTEPPPPPVPTPPLPTDEPSVAAERHPV